MNATCLRCKNTFECDRNDATFCSGACKAAWYRANGATEEHAMLHDFASKACEYCGNVFWFNAYANRGGQRFPIYCRDTCRVNAWRAGQLDKKRRAETARKDNRSWEAAQERAQSAANDAKKDIWSTLSVPRRWDPQDAYKWLGVNFGMPKAQTMKHYRQIVKEHHPDLNGGAEWQHLKHINAALDFLKRHFWDK